MPVSPNKPSKRAARAALSHFYRPADVAADLANIGPVDLWQDLAADPSSRLAGYRPEEELSAARLTADFVIPGDAEWPAALDALGDACPLGLWVRGSGDLADLSAHAVAVTGRRNSSASGTATAAQLTRELIDAGRTVTSALSYGIDTAAQHAAHAVPAPTVAVLPCGLDSCHPHNQTELLHSVVNRGGVAVSAYRPGTPASRNTLAATAQLLAALAGAVVLVEPAPDPSTGPLEAAQAAHRMGRPVLLLNSADIDAAAGHARRATRGRGGRRRPGTAGEAAQLLESVQAHRAASTADVIAALT
ncbi:DNA-processing protein DprA [Streptomyces lunaelactis]|uniref:DNA-processing protein DprA n=1 Tax=Streptomyces lunaelactis TaxID=1535768 RepID=UPI001584EDDE|nr:DNA-processing protein DprA [Streptomyces lunaelactis]NUK26908.1 DNA-processing protein DprA [Streptomyces lunaelactis]